MQDNKFKFKDMIIAIFCTILAILCIVFYFLPAFNVKHTASPMEEYEMINYSGWEITRATFSTTKVVGFNWDGLMYIKDAFGFPLIMAGVLMPLSIICSIVTAVFAYLSWLKNDNFKKFCFMFSLCGMIFQTITLIVVWYIALQIRSGNATEILNNVYDANMKGGMSYGSFVSLILAFVIAIIACAYNYFLENFDDEDDEEDEEDDDEEEEIVIVKKKRKKIVYVYEDEEDEEEPEVVKEKTKETKVEKPESTGGQSFIKVDKKEPAKKSSTKTSTSKTKTK